MDEVREALGLLLSLYSEALMLGPPSEPPVEYWGVEPHVSDNEWKAVFRKASRLPLQCYSEVFNPFPVSSEEPVVGALADDLADIYRDIVGPLQVFDAGYPDAARWLWTFRLRHHGGEHATPAIRVLHCYLADNGGFDAEDA